MGFELQKLPHEAEVGRDDAAALFDKLEGLFKFDAVGAHQISQADGSRARNTRLAVNKDASTFIPYRICGKRKKSALVKTQLNQLNPIRNPNAVSTSPNTHSIANYAL